MHHIEEPGWRRATAIRGTKLVSWTATLEATDFGGGATVIPAAGLGATQMFSRITTIDPGRATDLTRFARNIARLLPGRAARIRGTGNLDWIATAIQRRLTHCAILHAGSRVIQVASPTAGRGGLRLARRHRGVPPLWGRLCRPNTSHRRHHPPAQTLKAAGASSGLSRNGRVTCKVMR
jgi:hypothetical protein